MAARRGSKRRNGRVAASQAPAAPSGRLLLVGGGEQRSVNGEILRRFVEMAGGEKARILVCAGASGEPRSPLGDYRRVFSALGAADVHTESFGTRKKGEAPTLLRRLEQASAVFFTGGDQVQLTSRIAGTPFGVRVRERMARERLIVGGTSAGAAAMSSTMVVGGPSEGTVRRADVELAPGLGLWNDVVIDTHFNQRGRVARLMTIFGENPQTLGIGLDEDTAVEVRPGRVLKVLGTGVVLIFDGRVSHSNASDAGRDQVMALTDIRSHVLTRGYGFDLRSKRPLLPGGRRIPKPRGD